MTSGSIRSWRTTLFRVRCSSAARKLDVDLADALRSALERRTRKSVVLHERIDPEVIGGLRISIGDEVLDGTLSRGLQDMRRSLAATQPQG